MFEIRIHGRGGQGAKALAQILAEAAIFDGKFSKAFPEYGPERSGAPLASYVRISDKEIKTYEPILFPDAVLVLDETLMESVPVFDGLKENGILILNTSFGEETIKEKIPFKGTVIVLDAKKIAQEKLGENRPNIPILGAFLGLKKDLLSIESAEKAIKETFLNKIGEEKTFKNIEAFKAGLGR